MTTPHLTVDSASIYMFHLMSEHSRYQALVSEMKLNSNWGSHFHTFSLQSSSELASRKWTKLVLNDFLNYYCCKMCLLGMKRCAECTWNVYFFLILSYGFMLCPWLIGTWYVKVSPSRALAVIKESVGLFTWTTIFAYQGNQMYWLLTVFAFVSHAIGGCGVFLRGLLNWKLLWCSFCKLCSL